ncbi:2405_t:CDS:2, partial [Gigaspora rosea]
DHNKLEIISKMRCVYLCAQKHLPIFAYPDIVNLMNINFKNQTELINESEVQTLAPPFFGPKKDKLSSDVLESSNYAEYANSVSGNTFLYAIAIAIEESVLEELKKSTSWSLLIDESNTITHDKTCAIVSKHIANNIPVLRYLGLIELEEVDAMGIMNNLNNFFLAKMLEPLKLLHFGSDGDTLAGKDSAKDVPYFFDYEITIKELYAYFANFHSRWQNLQLIQAQDNEAPELSILQLRAQNLLEELDADFILATKFLADILSIILALCKVFQSDYIALSDVHQELNKTINSITIEFIGYPDENIDPTLGTHLRDYCTQNLIDIIPNFVKEFAKAMIINLQSRFPNTTLYCYAYF